MLTLSPYCINLNYIENIRKKFYLVHLNYAIILYEKAITSLHLISIRSSHRSRFSNTGQLCLLIHYICRTYNGKHYTFKTVYQYFQSIIREEPVNHPYAHIRNYTTLDEVLEQIVVIRHNQ